MAKSSTSDLGGWPVLKNGPVSEGAAFNEMMHRPDPGACYDADLNEELEDLFRKSVAHDAEFRELDFDAQFLDGGNPDFEEADPDFEKADPDDELLDETPRDVVAILGFDPLEDL